MTATQESPGLTPNIDVAPVNRTRSAGPPWPLNIYSSAVGKKWVMAITGIGLMGFVLAHMVGNLKMYLGPEEYNAYSESLRTLLHPILPNHTVLWVMRIGLIAMFILHLHSAYSLTMMNRRARPVSYQSRRDYLAANWAARTMRWSGILVLAFLLMHLSNLTWAFFPADVSHGENGGPTDVYQNVVNSLSVPWIAIAYIVGQLALGFHLFHGSWSIFQSLGANNPRTNVLRRGFAIGFTALVVGCNLTFPIAVLTGVVS